MLLTVENTLIFDARGDDAFEPLEGHGGERLQLQEGFTVPF